MGLGLSAQRVDVSQFRKILEGVPDDEQAKIAARNTARVYNFDVARLTAMRTKELFEAKSEPSNKKPDRS